MYPSSGPATPRRINTTGWGPSPSGVARNDGTLVSRSPLVNVTDSSRAVMTDLPPVRFCYSAAARASASR